MFKKIILAFGSVNMSKLDKVAPSSPLRSNSEFSTTTQPSRSLRI